MMHERRAETLSLVLIDHGESDFCRSRLHNDVTRAARDHGPAAFLDHCDQCDVVDKVDIHEKLDFGLCEVASYSKETAVKGLSAASSGGCDEVRSVVRFEGADFDPSSIAQRLKCRIVGCFQHDRQTCRRSELAASGRSQRPWLQFVKEYIAYLSVPNNVSTACNQSLTIAKTIVSQLFRIRDERLCVESRITALAVIIAAHPDCDVLGTCYLVELHLAWPTHS
jgi:hypothetical protein